MTTERTLEIRAVDPRSPESIQTFAEKSRQAEERRAEVAEAVDQVEAVNPATARAFRQAIANGEMRPAPIIEESSEEYADAA